MNQLNYIHVQLYTIDNKKRETCMFKGRVNREKWRDNGKKKIC